MVQIRVEIYKGPVSPLFGPAGLNLPGYTSRQLASNEFWAVVLPQPAAGTPAASWIAPVPADAQCPVATLGTQPLPSNTTQFLVTSACIPGGKFIPYVFHPVSPTGQDIGPVPTIGSQAGANQFCVAVPAPGASGIGIWLIKLDLYNQVSFPVACPNRNAVNEPPYNTSWVSRGLTPLYLDLAGEVKTNGARCGEITGITGNRSCFLRAQGGGATLPESQGIFTVQLNDPGSTLCSLTWQFKSHMTAQVHTFGTQPGIPLQITFDQTWDPGEWCVSVIAIPCPNAQQCAPEIFPMPGDPEFCFGLRADECPRIDSLTAAVDPKYACTYLFTVKLSGGFQGTRLVWDFSDGSSELPQPVTAATMTKGHTFAAQASGSAYVSVSLEGYDQNCCAPQQRSIWVDLPAEGCGGGPPPPQQPPSDEGDHGGGGKLCCGLIYTWLGGFVAGWILAYFNFWYPYAVIAWAAAAVALGLWTGLCCWPCMRRPHKCCNFIKWNILAHEMTLLTFGVIAGTANISSASQGLCSLLPQVCQAMAQVGGSGSGNQYVWYIVTAGVLFWKYLAYQANCQASWIVVTNPSTWPKCRCKS